MSLNRKLGKLGKRKLNAKIYKDQLWFASTA